MSTIKKQGSLFATDKRRKFDRYFGGNVGNQEPFISGYIFAKFIPTNENSFTRAFSNIAYEGGTLTSQTQFSMLESTLLNVNIPGQSLNKTTFNGLGGRRWSVPTTLEYTDSISVRHTEFSGTPISDIYSRWMDLIRDPLYGVAATPDDQTTVDKSTYSVTLLVWMTDPSIKHIEKGYAYTGLFPMKDPMDVFSGDIQTNDKVEIDMDFNVDMIYDQKKYDWLMDKITSLNDDMQGNLFTDNFTANTKDDSRFKTDTTAMQ